MYGAVHRLPPVFHLMDTNNAALRFLSRYILPDGSRASTAIFFFLEARAIAIALAPSNVALPQEGFRGTTGQTGSPTKGQAHTDNEMLPSAMPDPRWQSCPRKRAEAFYARHLAQGAPMPFALDQPTRDALACVLARSDGWRSRSHSSGSSTAATRAPFVLAASKAYQRLKFEVCRFALFSRTPQIETVVCLR